MSNLAQTLIDILKEKKLTVSIAESCTGGMLAASITDISGASNIFERGYITYANSAKKEILGVSDSILNENGAVSPECAEAMANGLRKISNANICISITGIAGPTGATASKPFGLVYIATKANDNPPEITECFFKGDRKEVREQATQKALSLIIDAAFTI